MFLFQKFYSLTYLRSSLQIYPLGSCLWVVFCLWSFVITKRLFVIFVITKLYFSLLFAWLCVYLLCRGVWESWSCVLQVYIVVIPQWRSLCGRFCVDIVKIFLCEGGDVMQWLECQNISFCLCLIFFLSTLISLCLALSLLPYLICLILYVCPHLYWTKRAIKASQLIIQRNREE